MRDKGLAAYDRRITVILCAKCTMNSGYSMDDSYANVREDAWYICNDENVFVKPDRSAKRQKTAIGPLTPPMHSSRDAYMLVYKRRRNTPPSRAPPKIVVDRVREDNVAFETILNDWGVR